MRAIKNLYVYPYVKNKLPREKSTREISKWTPRIIMRFSNYESLL